MNKQGIGEKKKEQCRIHSLLSRDAPELVSGANLSPQHEDTGNCADMTAGGVIGGGPIGFGAVLKFPVSRIENK